MSCYLKKLFSLKGKVAAVTGKKDRINRTIANGLVESGAEVYNFTQSSILSTQVYNKTQNSTDETGNFDSFPFPCQKFFQKNSRLNIIVNTLAITIPQQDIQDELEQQAYFYRILKPDLTETIASSKVAMKLRKKSGFGAIINLIYLSKPVDYQDCYNYVTIRNSLNIITKKWASDLIKDNISINNIALVDVTSKPRKNQIEIIQNSDREQELMGTIIFLASQNSLQITGQNIFYFCRP